MQYYNDVLIMDTWGDGSSASGFCLVEMSLDLVELVCHRVELARRLSAEETDLVKLVYHDRHLVLCESRRRGEADDYEAINTRLEDIDYGACPGITAGVVKLFAHRATPIDCSYMEACSNGIRWRTLVRGAAKTECTSWISADAFAACLPPVRAIVTRHLRRQSDGRTSEGVSRDEPVAEGYAAAASALRPRSGCESG